MSLLWTSHIASYASLQSRLSIKPPTPSVAARLGVSVGVTFDTILHEYLQGSGAPCPGLLSAVEAQFDPIVDLSHIDSPTFRAKVFSWASTGTPFVEAGSAPISVCIYFLLSLLPLLITLFIRYGLSTGTIQRMQTTSSEQQ